MVNRKLATQIWSDLKCHWWAIGTDILSEAYTGHMVPKPLPPVAGITIARPGQRTADTVLAWIPWSVNATIIFTLFLLQVQKGSKPDVCLSTTLFAFYNSTALHTLLPGSATGKTIGSLCALPFPHNPPFPEVTQSTMSKQCTYSLLISQLKDCFLPEPRWRAPLKQKVLKLMFFPPDSNSLFMVSDMRFSLTEIVALLLKKAMRYFWKRNTASNSLIWKGSSRKISFKSFPGCVLVINSISCNTYSKHILYLHK